MRFLVLVLKRRGEFGVSLSFMLVPNPYLLGFMRPRVFDFMLRFFTFIFEEMNPRVFFFRKGIKEFRLIVVRTSVGRFYQDTEFIRLIKNSLSGEKSAVILISLI